MPSRFSSFMMFKLTIIFSLIFMAVADFPISSTRNCKEGTLFRQSSNDALVRKCLKSRDRNKYSQVVGCYNSDKKSLVSFGGTADIYSSASSAVRYKCEKNGSIIQFRAINCVLEDGKVLNPGQYVNNGRGRLCDCLAKPNLQANCYDIFD